MPGAMRVFISSTMIDLANERAAVVDQLRDFNFEPIHAENIAPTGEDSWRALESEIDSCEAFVLILGERYGWIPPGGPHDAEGLSVTELEFRAARARGLPVFTFFKKLPYGTPSATPDALRRDKFRAEVAAWGTGYFKGDFELARDLAPFVVKSLMNYLFERARGAPAPRIPRTPPASVQSIALPSKLIDAINDRSAILWAGAGMSLQAGLPSAAMFSEAFLSRVQEHDPLYVRQAHGGDFNSIADDLERLLGGAALASAVNDLMALDKTTPPSIAQTVGVRSFDLIVTTNYDTLLERADSEPHLTVIDDETTEALPNRALIKLHGSLGNAESLVLTDHQLREHASRRRHLLALVADELRRRPLLVVGSSLRDPSTIALLNSCCPNVRGWVVGPEFSQVDRLRASDWNLQPVFATAESFFSSLEDSILAEATHLP